MKKLTPKCWKYLYYDLLLNTGMWTYAQKLKTTPQLHPLLTLLSCLAQLVIRSMVIDTSTPGIKTWKYKQLTHMSHKVKLVSVKAIYSYTIHLQLYQNYKLIISCNKILNITRCWIPLGLLTSQIFQSEDNSW